MVVRVRFQQGCSCHQGEPGQEGGGELEAIVRMELQLGQEVAQARCRGTSRPRRPVRRPVQRRGIAMPKPGSRPRTGPRPPGSSGRSRD